MTPDVLAALRNVLIKLYADESSIRRVVTDAGLISARIQFGGAAIDVWHAVLNEATKNSQIDALLHIVQIDYGDNLDLQRVYTRYRTAIEQPHNIDITHADLPDESSLRAYHVCLLAPDDVKDERDAVYNFFEPIQPLHRYTKLQRTIHGC